MVLVRITSCRVDEDRIGSGTIEAELNVARPFFLSLSNLFPPQRPPLCLFCIYNFNFSSSCSTSIRFAPPRFASFLFSFFFFFRREHETRLSSTSTRHHPARNKFRRCRGPSFNRTKLNDRRFNFGFNSWTITSEFIATHLFQFQFFPIFSFGRLSRLVRKRLNIFAF